jgi:hypothetical protein
MDENPYKAPQVEDDGVALDEAFYHRVARHSRNRLRGAMVVVAAGGFGLAAWLVGRLFHTPTTGC